MSSQHIIGECGALMELRMKYFKRRFILPPFDDLSKKALAGFIGEAPIDELRFFLDMAEGS